MKNKLKFGKPVLASVLATIVCLSSLIIGVPTASALDTGDVVTVKNTGRKTIYYTSGGTTYSTYFDSFADKDTGTGMYCLEPNKASPPTNTKYVCTGLVTNADLKKANDRGSDGNPVSAEYLYKVMYTANRLELDHKYMSIKLIMQKRALGSWASGKTFTGTNKAIYDEAVALAKAANESTAETRIANVSISSAKNVGDVSGSYTILGKYTISGTFDSWSYAKSGTNTSGVVYSKSGNTLTVKIPTSKLTATVKHGFKVTVKESSAAVLKFEPQTSGTNYQALARYSTYNTTDTASKSGTFKPTTSVVVNKVDTDSNDALSGAKFKLVGGDYNSTKTTNSNGKITFTDVPFGSYTLTETETPDGYNLGDQSSAQTKKTFTINSTATKNITVENTKSVVSVLGSIKVTKVDADDTSLKLDGAEFELSQGGTVIATGTTDANGEITFTDLPLGSYVLKETVLPDGYKWEDQIESEIIKNITINNENQNHTQDVKNFLGIPDTGYLKIVKYDSESNKTTDYNDNTFEGGVYRITDSNGRIRDIMLVDGVAISPELEVGEYKIQEIEAPVGYEVNDTVYTVEVTKGEITEAVVLNVYDAPIKGTVKIHKTGDRALGVTDNGPVDLSGAKFGIYQKGSDVLLKSGTTDEKGILEFTDLYYGEYTIKELEAPEGYLITEESDTDISITESGTQTVEFVNTAIVNNIEITKKDSKTELVVEKTGTKFNIICSDGSLYYDEDGNHIFETNEDGKVVILNIPYGEYDIKEIETIDGYLLNNKTVHFAITNSSDEISIDFYNDPCLGKIKIYKQGEMFTKTTITNSAYGKLYTPEMELVNLSGVVFNVVAAENIKLPDGNDYIYADTIVDTITTDEDGYATSIDLYPGIYRLIEISGYDFHNKEIEIPLVEIVNANEPLKIVEADVKNYYKTTQIEFQKLFEEYKDLTPTSETVFGMFADTDILYGEETIVPKDSLIELITPDEYGKISVETKLPLSQYYIRELSTNEHYIVSDEKISMNFDTELSTTETIVYKVNDGTPVQNTLKRGSVSVVKTDLRTNQVLGGCEFTLYDGETPIMVKTTDENGLAVFEGVVYGKYTLKETAAPYGYTLNNQVFEVNITENGQMVNISATNRPIEGTLKVLKIDEKGNPLEGVEITLYKDGKAVETKITNEFGIVEFTLLRVGDYTYRETKQLKGYIIDKTTYKFSVETDGEVIEKTLVNKQTKVVVNKVDSSTNKPLAGATIVIKDEDGNVVYKGVTDKNGSIKVEGLEVGKNYTAQETKQPKGYILNDDEYSFYIDEDGNVVGDTIITNDLAPTRAKEEKSPKTRDNVWPLVACGTAMILSLGVIVIMEYKIKRRKKKE